MLRPGGSQPLHDPGVVETNCSLEKHQELRREPRPAFSQNEVVGVLNMQACDAMKHVERGEQFLHVQKTHVPRLVLHGESGLQGIRCTAVSSTGVVENNCQFAQESPDRALPAEPASATNIFVF